MGMIRMLLLCLLVSTAVIGQVDSVYMGLPPDSTVTRKKIKNNDWLKKVTYGGNFHAWFGNPAFVFLSPSIGYVPVEQLNVGVGMVYNYMSTDAGYYGRYKHSIFGGHSYVRYIIAKNYLLQLQYDKLRQPDFFIYPVTEKVWVDYLLVGGGFRHPIGDKAALTSSLMYNLTPHPLSIYPSRLIIQFGFMGGF
jgi:hypothetical protein